MLRRFFLDHPASVGETYWEHARAAAGFGLTMVIGGLACIIHALLPALFPKTASNAVKRLHMRMSNRVGAATRSQARNSSLPWQLEYEI